MTWQMIEGDCVEAMAAMDEASVDAIVTDPPYGLHFMGKTWDQFGGPTGHKNTNGNPERGGAMKAGEYDLRLSGQRGFQAEAERWGTAMLRVLKPGGHLLMFGGTRTYHRLTCALEDAGFEIRDCLAWLYGSGFPKSLDVSKAIDKAAGAQREVVKGGGRSNVGTGARSGGESIYSQVLVDDTNEHTVKNDTSLPATPDAQRWQGWGTALKPAFEPIVLARKPLAGTVAANVLNFGTGALNIDGTRIGTDEADDIHAKNPHTRGGFGHAESSVFTKADPVTQDYDPTRGRWPANVLLDEQAAEMLDEQSGETTHTKAGEYGTTKNVEVGHGIYGGGQGLAQEGLPVRGYGDRGGASRYFTIIGQDEPCRVHGIRRCTICLPALDEHGVLADLDGDYRLWFSEEFVRGLLSDHGGASRFFYTAKAGRGERNRGLEHREAEMTDSAIRRVDQGLGGRGTNARELHPTRNTHPTVKPVALMQWLCRLITPPKGTVLDPFTGSGTTGLAALREGFDFIGIEREAEYVEIARDRIIGDAPLFNVTTELI